MSISLYRVIQPVTDIEEAAQFYSAVLGDEGERMFYAKDPFGNPVSFVDEGTVFDGNNAGG